MAYPSVGPRRPRRRVRESLWTSGVYGYGSTALLISAPFILVAPRAAVVIFIGALVAVAAWSWTHGVFRSHDGRVYARRFVRRIDLGSSPEGAWAFRRRPGLRSATLLLRAGPDDTWRAVRSVRFRLFAFVSADAQAELERDLSDLGVRFGSVAADTSV